MVGAGNPPRAGIVIGVACILLGIAMFAVSIFNPAEELPVAATTTTSPVYAADLADGTTAPVSSEGLGVGFATERNGRRALSGFGEAEITITAGDGRVCKLCVLTAVNAAQRGRGLMEVTDQDLGGYDGMLFEFPEEVSNGFWMRNTPLPLSIAYFDAKGRLVSTTDMEPCEDSDSCPSYQPQAPFQYALEVPQGFIEDAGAVGAAVLRIDSRVCPLATPDATPDATPGG